MSTDVNVSVFQDKLAALELEIVKLCDSQNDPDGYFRIFLEKIVALLGDGGAVWSVSKDGETRARCYLNMAAAGLEPEGSQSKLLITTLARVYQTCSPVVLPAGDSTNLYNGGMSDELANESDHALLFVPIMVQERIESILLLISPVDVDARAIGGYLGFVAGLCERASVFLLRSDLQSKIRQINRADRLRQFVSSLHCSLDLRRVGYALANYSQELLGVYRCTAGTYNSKGKFRVEAVSGLESVAVKSALVQNIATVARQVCKNDKVLIVDNPNAAMKAETAGADDLVTAARLYMIQADSVMMGVFPIKSDGCVVGALIIEKASEETFELTERQQIYSITVEAGSAISNALAYRHLPFAFLMRSLGSLRDKIYRTDRIKRLFWATVLIVVAALPFIIQRQVRVIGNAELTAQKARMIYAQQTGMIERVSMPADRMVEAGDELAVLDVREIDSEITRVANQIAEVNVLSKIAERGSNTNEYDRLKYFKESLEAELEKYNIQRQRYVITAPIAGMVVTRESEIRKLLNKPVIQGDLVLEIVPRDVEWEFEVNVPEDEVGHLLAAYKQLPDGERLGASLILLAHPERVFKTHVLKVAPRAFVETTGEQKYRNVITVTVAEPAELKELDLRQGMAGKVAIECGQRNLFYICTYEIADFLRINMF